jgi:hypothetical protein
LVENNYYSMITGKDVNKLLEAHIICEHAKGRSQNIGL